MCAIEIGDEMADERILAKCAAGRNGELILSPNEGFWSTCPTVQVDPEVSAYELFDDFMASSIGDVTGRWMKDVVGAATTVGLASSVTYGLGGFIVLDAGITAKNDYANLKVTDADAALGAFKITANSGKKLWFAVRFGLSSVADECMCIGLLDGTTTKPFANDTGARNMTGGLYFRTLAASPTALDFARTRGSTEAVIKAGIATLVDSIPIIAGFYFDGVKTVLPFINGVQANYPTQVNVATFPYDIGLTPYIGILAGANASKKLIVDWVRVVQIR